MSGKLSLSRIGSVIRAARKRAGLTQQKVASTLGVSQSAVSKMENGVLVPAAPEWFEFCELCRISPDSITTGFVEGEPCGERQFDLPNGFKLPKAYAEDPGSKVRALVPFIRYFEDNFGEKKLEAFMKSLKLDSDFFVALDNEINLGFCLDISRQLVKSGVLALPDVSRLAQAASKPATHGCLHRNYDSGRSSQQRLKLLLMNATSYERNFTYRIEDEGRPGLTFSVKPQARIERFPYADDAVLGDFLCRYKKSYFQSFTTYGNAVGAELKEKQCHFKGADRCVYEFTFPQAAAR